MTFNIYSLVCIISMVSSSGPFMGYCMDQLVPVRENAPSAGRRLLYWTLFPLLSISVKVIMMSMQNAAVIVAIGNVIYIGGNIMIIWKYYDGKALDKYRVYAALMFMIIAGDVTFGALNLLVTGQALEIASYNTAGVAAACTGSSLIACIYMVQIVWLGNRGKQKGKLYIPVLMVLLIVLACTGISASGDTQTRTITYDAAFIFATAGILFALYICLNILFSLGQIRNTKREQEAFLQTLEIERMRYRALEERREELAKLRHDYRNILTTVTILLENGDTEEAGKLLSDITSRVNAAGQEEAGKLLSDITSRVSTAKTE